MRSPASVFGREEDAMDKVNFKKDLAELYNPKNTEWDWWKFPR
jgi:hypothetical protein